MTDFFEAWQYLCNCDYYKHPKHGTALSAFPTSLHIEVVKVNPENNTIEDDVSLNTKTEVWLESGCWILCDDAAQYEPSHDFTLDVGADTFEEAVIKLCVAVKEKEQHNVDR